MRSALLSAGLVCLAACAEDGPVATDAGAPPSASVAPSASVTSSAAPSGDKLEPVYPREDVPHDPMAVKFCEAVQGSIPTKRNACCNPKKATEPVNPLISTFAGECARTLSYAIRHDAVTLDADAVDKCVTETAALLEGCDWVGTVAPRLPEVCATVIKGRVAEKELCRSSLECSAGLYCFGLGAIKPGRCGKPLPAGAACGAGVDTLASYTVSAHLRDHPVCAGYCARQCKETVAVGGKCNKSDECGKGHACRDGACAAGDPPGAGESCPQNECADGLRCLEGSCVAPKLAGEKCTRELECRGACEIPAGAAEGLCVKRCPSAPNVKVPPIPGATQAVKPKPGAKPGPKPKP